MSINLSPQVNHEIQLADDQRKQIIAVHQEYKDEIKQETRRFLMRIEEISQANHKKIQGVLTNEQKHKTDVLIGKPFNFDPGAAIYKLLQENRVTKSTLNKSENQPDK